MKVVKNFLLRQMARQSSLRNIWPLVVGTSSCTAEFLAARRECRSFHGGLFAPEQADVLIICGHVNRAMLTLVLEFYQRMPEGKRVMLVGLSALERKWHGNLYGGGIQLSDHVPVDVEVIGSPPNRENILKGLQELAELYRQGLEV